MRKKSKLIIFSILIIYMFSVTNAFAFSMSSSKMVLGQQIRGIAIKSAALKGISLNFKKEALNTIMLYSYVPKSQGKNSISTTTTTGTKNVKPMSFTQFDDPTSGDEIAVITTNKGIIKIKLLPQYAPKTVELFKSRVNEGYYNGLNVNRIIADSMIQCGTTSIAKATISATTTSGIDEFNSEVRNFRGAVSTVNGSVDQFSIVQANAKSIAKDPLALKYMANSGEKLFPKEVVNKYKKVGGMPWLDHHNVVFAQIVQSLDQGMKIVDKISEMQVDEDNKPKKEIKIVKIEIVIQK